MPSRMDRYKEEIEQKAYSRSNRNQELYQNIGSNTRYTNITDVTNANAIDLDSVSKNGNTRESYHQMKAFNQNIETPKVKKELDDFNYLYQDRENRIYDVNRVLEEARKNRSKDDVQESKRKLKNSSYNIITSLNAEELEKYRKESINRVHRPEDEGLRELLDTITSKTLAGEIDKATTVDLLSDLMATNILDKVAPVEKDEEKEETREESTIQDSSSEKDLSLSQTVLNKEQLEKIKEAKDKGLVDEEEPKLKGADSDFYTRSMDLSDEDFEIDDEFKEKSMPVALKVILIIILLAAIAVAGYFVYKTFLEFDKLLVEEKLYLWYDECVKETCI